jgi:UDP-N-acetylglucosamine 3-dehydrogenase
VTSTGAWQPVGGDRRIRVGLVGLGAMGRNHLRLLAGHQDVELVLVADPVQDSLAAAVASVPGARGAADALATLRHDDALALDALVIASPTTTHLPLALAAIERGIAVLVEKPLAATPAEADRIVEASAEHGVPVAVGHVERFNPVVLELGRLLDEGWLSTVYAITSRRAGPFPARIRDVGVVVDLAPHDIDVMRYLVDSEPIRLFAETERRIHTDHEDLFVGTMKFANGVVGVLDINWLTPTKRRTLTVTGERGMYVADYIAQDLVFYANQDAADTWVNRGAGRSITSVTEGEMTSHAIRREEPLVVELRDFADAVRTGGPPPVDPRDAMIALLLARTMVEAGERGEVIGGVALEEVVR